MIHYTPEGKAHLLSQLLYPQPVKLYRDLWFKDPNISVDFCAIHRRNLEEACIAIDSSTGWKRTRQVAIYDENINLLAVITDEGEEPLWHLQKQVSNIN